MGGQQSAIRGLGVAVGAVLVLVVLTPIALIAGGAPAAAPPPGSGIPGLYMSIYALGERTYHVNRFLLASIHFQETRLSTLRAASLVGDAVTGGWNACGAAGPMQMGIVGVAPYDATTAGACSAGPTCSRGGRRVASSSDRGDATMLGCSADRRVALWGTRSPRGSPARRAPRSPRPRGRWRAATTCSTVRAPLARRCCSASGARPGC
jgi:hypothetical protein